MFIFLMCSKHIFSNFYAVSSFFLFFQAMYEFLLYLGASFLSFPYYPFLIPLFFALLFFAHSCLTLYLIFTIFFFSSVYITLVFLMCVFSFCLTSFIIPSLLRLTFFLPCFFFTFKLAHFPHCFLSLSLLFGRGNSCFLNVFFFFLSLSLCLPLFTHVFASLICQFVSTPLSTFFSLIVSSSSFLLLSWRVTWFLLY